MTEVEDVIARYRVAELYSAWRDAQDRADQALEDLQDVICDAKATRAWGLLNALAKLTGWSREHIRRLAKKPRPAGR